jgi:predicted transcriptional regulator
VPFTRPTTLDRSISVRLPDEAHAVLDALAFHELRTRTNLAQKILLDALEARRGEVVDRRATVLDAGCGRGVTS